MTPIEYQALAKRTTTPKAIDDRNFGLVNWSLGIAGETAEVQEFFEDWKEGQIDFDPVLLTKELGDVLWYTAIMCEQTNTTLDALPVVDPKETPSAARLAIYGGKVADYVKKVVCHGHDLDEQKLWQYVGMVYFLTKAVAVNQGLNVGEVMAANIAKLKERYPDGFTTEASINRTS